MKRASIAVAVLVALTLTGCAGTPESAPSEPEQAPTSTSEQTTEESAAPATVEPTEPTTTDSEQWFLTHGFIASLDLGEDEKLAAGYFACEQVAAGNLDVVAVEGVDEATNSSIVASATVTLCPELEATYEAHRQG